MDELSLPAAMNRYQKLVDAAGAGHVADVSVLLAESIPSPSQCRALLMIAASHGHAAVVDVLLREARADPVDCLALRAAVAGGHAQTVAVFLADGGGINASSAATLWGCIAMAAALGHVPVVEVLSRDPRFRGGISRALAQAARADEDRSDVVRLLLGTDAATDVPSAVSACAESGSVRTLAASLRYGRGVSPSSEDLVNAAARERRHSVRLLAQHANRDKVWAGLCPWLAAARWDHDRDGRALRVLLLVPEVAEIIAALGGQAAWRALRVGATRVLSCALMILSSTVVGGAPLHPAPRARELPTDVVRTASTRPPCATTLTDVSADGPMDDRLCNGTHTPGSGTQPRHTIATEPASGARPARSQVPARLVPVLGMGTGIAARLLSHAV